MQPTVLTPIAEDYQRLLSVNPLAAAELKGIVLARLLAEKDAELKTVSDELTVLQATELEGVSDTPTANEA
jgi:hypothetical protein